MYSKENVTESSCIVNEMSLIMYVECCFVMGNICYSTSYNLANLAKAKVFQHGINMYIFVSKMAVMTSFSVFL